TAVRGAWTRAGTERRPLAGSPRSALAKVLGRVSPQPQDRRSACRSGLSARPAGNRLHRRTEDHDVPLRRGGAAALTRPLCTRGPVPSRRSRTHRKGTNHSRGEHREDTHVLRAQANPWTMSLCELLEPIEWATHPCRGDRDVAGRMLLRADSLRGGGP